MRKVQREREKESERKKIMTGRDVEQRVRQERVMQNKSKERRFQKGERDRGRHGEWGLRQLNIACYKMINTLIQSYEDTSSPVMRESI